MRNGRLFLSPTRPETSTNTTATDPTTPPTTANTPSGKIAFIQLDQSGSTPQTNLVIYDVTTQAITPLFTPPANSILYAAAFSPDNNQVAMAYAPPPPADGIQFGYTGLYQLQVGSETPTLLIEKQVSDEIFFHPTWSPDGKHIIFSHMGPEDGSPTGFFQVTLEQLNTETGETAVLAPDGIWPRVSPDGSQIVYAYSEPTSQGNELVVINADGTNPRKLTSLDDFVAVDSPLWSPDGRFIYFSAVTEDTLPLPTPTSFWDRLFGVKTALAHDVPSDWWRIPADGSGPPERLTEVREIGLYGDFSPDGRFLAFISTTGLFIMEADGSNLHKVLETAVVGGALSWIP
jgi:Tol biopolymer transport system component